MAETAAGPGVDDLSSHRRLQLELNHVKGSSPDAAIGAAVGAMEEGRVCGTVYVHTDEPHHESQVSNYRKLAAEAVATFVLVFLGCGSIVANRLSDGAVTHVGISLTFGLAIMVMVRAVGHISGAHMNPAVTIAFASVKDFPLRLVPFYIAAQVGGAIVAGFVLRLMFDHDLSQDLDHLGATHPHHGDLQALAMEFVITMVLMFVVSSVAVDSKSVGELAGLILGWTIALLALVGGTVSGASMNPARSIGPAVAANWYKGLWIYIAGPIPGAVVGAWLYPLVHGPQHIFSESQVRIRPHSHRRRKKLLFGRKREPVTSVADERAENGINSL